MLWWFYHPPPSQHTPFGTLPDIYGLVAGISQCICSIVQYGYCLRHADSPFKASLLPAIFLICLVGSRLSNNRMNANTSSTEETSLHPIPEYYAPTNIPFLDNQEVEGNIEQQEQEQEREQELERLLQSLEQLRRERERLLQRELDPQELHLRQQRVQEWEQERVLPGERQREQLRQWWEQQKLRLQSKLDPLEREQLRRVLQRLQEQLETKLK
ncbi:PREDICTED: trichohyalin-like isoform X2 [Prunus mume]|uniref:Trichohyalin-like isoform X2 n=1 Tax=Prunus mume TaxID=102107 RepID=A0ABM0NEQ8_PRUMU|nr:PREDICTED: trichohyalin-like isoform X2 [Prunus mume]